MLVLTRADGESFFVGDNIKVRVLAVRGGNVRIGVEAPKDVAVLREELKSALPLGSVEVPAAVRLAG